MTDYILIFLVSLLAGSVHALSGFGYIIIAMALFPMFLPAGSFLILAQLGGLFMSFVLIWNRMREINWKKIFFPSLFSSVGGIVGLMFFKNLSTGLYMRILGIALIALSLWMSVLSARVKIRACTRNGIIVGSIGGVMGALFGVSAPALVLYYNSNMESKDDYTLSLQATLTVQTGVCLIGRAAMDMWSPGSALLFVPALLGILLGKLPGKWLYGKLDVEAFKKVVYIFVAVFGIYIFLSNL